VAELMIALESLYCLTIIYKNINPENILLDGRGHVVLVKFFPSGGVCAYHRVHIDLLIKNVIIFNRSLEITFKIFYAI